MSAAGGGVETEAQLAVSVRDDRRDPPDGVAGRVLEADDGVIAPVRAGDDRSRRSEVDAEVQRPVLLFSHPRDRGQLFLPPGPTSRGRFGLVGTGHVR